MSDPDSLTGPLLVELQDLIVRALLLADERGCIDVAIGLDEARLCLAARMRRAGLSAAVIEVPTPWDG